MPRTLPEINREYNTLCAQLGEKLLQISSLETARDNLQARGFQLQAEGSQAAEVEKQIAEAAAKSGTAAQGAPKDEQPSGAV